MTFEEMVKDLRYAARVPFFSWVANCRNPICWCPLYGVCHCPPDAEYDNHPVESCVPVVWVSHESGCVLAGRCDLVGFDDDHREFERRFLAEQIGGK